MSIATIERHLSDSPTVTHTVQDVAFTADLSRCTLTCSCGWWAKARLMSRAFIMHDSHRGVVHVDPAHRSVSLADRDAS